jgi:hypothetical protein
MGDSNDGAQNLLVLGGAALAIICVIIAIAVG